MEQETEQLTINERKIIDILLKHLMDLQNEFAYFKNKVGLQLPDDDISARRQGSKHLLSDESLLLDGSKHSISDESLLPDGSKHFLSGESLLPDGSKYSLSGESLLPDGSKHSLSGESLLPEGSKHFLSGESLLSEGSNRAVWLHKVFEQRLIEALEQYIKIGNGQNSLYSFYTDFEEAVAQKNEQEMKMKEAAKQIPLEDTHNLPTIIPIDVSSVAKVRNALVGHLPPSANHRQRETVAKELLGLHNAGKATAAQISEFGGLSLTGIAKHLPRMQRADLIKKQPPCNYALTEKSKHILLKTFGIPKNIAKI